MLRNVLIGSAGSINEYKNKNLHKFNSAEKKFKISPKEFRLQIDKQRQRNMVLMKAKQLFL